MKQKKGQEYLIFSSQTSAMMTFNNIEITIATTSYQLKVEFMHVSKTTINSYPREDPISHYKNRHQENRPQQSFAL